MKYSLLSIILLFVSVTALAQENNQEKKAITYSNAFLISPSYTFQLPAGDMIQSYGFNHNLGIEFGYKFGANWYVGAEGNFIFSRNVKDQSILDNILTSSGFLIGKDGFLESVNLSERGMILTANIGKTFFFSHKQPNSGLLVKFGVGYIDHKIFIDVNQNNVPQLDQQTKKGYDRFSSGVALKQYIGLIRLKKKSFLNLSFGIEATEGITKNRRPFDFPTGQTFDKLRFDFLVGFKFNWYLPVFNGKNNKSGSEYYYY